LREVVSPRGFIATNLGTSSRAVVRFYNRRGTAEQWIREGKQAVAMTRLSCHRFRVNEVRLRLSVLAYNLGNLWRRLALPKAIGSWSLTSLQQRLVTTGEISGLLRYRQDHRERARAGTDAPRICARSGAVALQGGRKGSKGPIPT
jgi:Transposase DDE domain group 1